MCGPSSIIERLPVHVYPHTVKLVPESEGDSTCPMRPCQEHVSASVFNVQPGRRLRGHLGISCNPLLLRVNPPMLSYYATRLLPRGDPRSLFSGLIDMHASNLSTRHRRQPARYSYVEYDGNLASLWEADVDNGVGRHRDPMHGRQCSVCG